MASLEDGFEIIDPKDLEEIKEAMENKDLSTVVEKVQDYFEQQDRVELNIAITGESGSGKSTFINAFRGLGDEEEGSAPTGVVETTMKPEVYPHPKYPNVKVWDLPGIGTPNFKADEYLEEVGFQRYDFFIIVSSDRFRECHAQLANEINKMKKKFYFIRSKIDSNIDAESRKKNFNKEKMLDVIRRDCMKGLQSIGVSCPDVFLISCFDLGSYDFGLLEETMERELPQHKRHALMLALPNISLDINNKKRKALQADIWKLAALSAGVAAIPVPGLGASADVGILVIGLRRFYNAFSLDDQSLQRLADKSGKSFEELKSVLKSPLHTEISRNVVIKLLNSSVGYAVENVVEYFLSTIPVVGSLAAGALSFGTIYYMLNKCLNELAEDGRNVLMVALQSSVDPPPPSHPGEGSDVERPKAP
ncbi:interferon-inducible GTPase 5-like [Chanos chanos]|uniref:Interferon-inducible GTPase 5-like n=1 Tax=Chanos chanos TaxID=29144 RepID=A0A6J2X031_CHACN|nr:interferon-inducible GTPase 5-like [Chanos chanos]